MRVGINFFPAVSPSEKSPAEYYKESLELALRADTLGFSHVRTVEHYFFAWGGYSPDPVPLLSAVAARTSRIRVVVGAVIPAFDHPIKIAGKLAVLDNISLGRLDAGFGRAFLPAEFDAFGVALDESRQRFEDGVEAVRRLWTQPAPEWTGRFHSFGPLPPMLPPPYQKPHPPIYCAVTLSEDSYAWAGSRGYNLMIVPYVAPAHRIRELLSVYRRARSEAGHEGPGLVQMSYHCVIAESSREAVRRATEAFEDYKRKQLDAIQSWSRRKSTAYPGYDKLLDSIREVKLPHLLDDARFLAGSPIDVRGQVARIHESFGDADLSIQVNFATLSAGEALETIERFASDVMPHMPLGQ